MSDLHGEDLQISVTGDTRRQDAFSPKDSNHPLPGERSERPLLAPPAARRAHALHKVHADQGSQVAAAPVATRLMESPDFGPSYTGRAHFDRGYGRIY